MAETKTELERFAAHLRHLERPVVHVLRPGVTNRTLEERFGNVPASVSEWFSWQNGVTVRPGQIQDEVNVIPGYTLVSVEEAESVKPIYEGDPMLGELWAPLLENGAGDMFAAVWQHGSEARVARVWVEEDTSIEFESIPQLVRLFNECFESQAFYVDRDGRFSINSEIYDEIYNEHVA